MNTLYTQRIEVLQKKFKKNKIDAFVIIDRVNTFYLTGFKGSISYTLITPGTCYLFTDFRYIEYAEKEIKEIEIILIDKDFKKVFNKIVKKEGITSMGFEGSISYSEYEKMKKIVKDIQLIESSKLITDMRIIKSDYEIRSIRECIKNNDKIFSEIIKDVKINKEEIVLARKLRQLMDNGDREGEGFPTIVAAGANSAMPHYMPGEYRIRENDFVLLDFGVKFNNYCADMTRTVVVGMPDVKQKEIHNIVLTAQLKAIESVKAGIKAKDADAAARNYIRKKRIWESVWTRARAWHWA